MNTSKIYKFWMLMVIIVPGCMQYFEERSNYYPNYLAVLKASESSRLWLPKFLPRSAINIYETHEIDTNFFKIRFEFDVNELNSITIGFTSAKKEEVFSYGNEISQEKWWKIEHLNEIKFYKIKTDLDQTAYLIIQENPYRAYYWTGYPPPQISTVK